MKFKLILFSIFVSTLVLVIECQSDENEDKNDRDPNFDPYDETPIETDHNVTHHIQNETNTDTDEYNYHESDVSISSVPDHDQDVESHNDTLIYNEEENTSSQDEHDQSYDTDDTMEWTNKYFQPSINWYGYLPVQTENRKSDVQDHYNKWFQTEHQSIPESEPEPQIYAEPEPYIPIKTIPYPENYRLINILRNN